MLASADVMRSAQGLRSFLSELQEKAIARAADVLTDGIETTEELTAAVRALDVNWPPVIFDDEYDPEASAAAADVVANTLVINETPDVAATEAARAAVRQEVEEVSVPFREGQTIVAEGEVVTAVHAAAINSLGLLNQTGLEVLAMLAVVTMLVGMLSFYLARFREQFWANTKRVILFGALIALAAGAARLIGLLTPDDNLTVGYLIPAATFGFMAAILFDARIGVIMSLAVGALTGIATRDPGLTLFAAAVGYVPDSVRFVDLGPWRPQESHRVHRFGSHPSGGRHFVVLRRAGNRGRGGFVRVLERIPVGAGRGNRRLLLRDHL